MKLCPKCKTEYENNRMFCPRCGSKLVEKIKQSYCVYCGEKVDSVSDFCSFCGNRLLKFNKRKEVSSLKVCSHCNVEYHYDFRFCPICGHKMREIKSSFFKYMSLFIAYFAVFVVFFSISFITFKNKSDVYPIIFETIKLEQPNKGYDPWVMFATDGNSNPYKRSDKEIFGLFVSTFENGYKYVSTVNEINYLISIGLYADEEMPSLVKDADTYGYVFLRDKAILNENNVSYIDCCYIGAVLASMSFLIFLISFSLVTCVWYVLFYKLNIDWSDL